MRVLFGLMYLSLAAGALVVIYPFMLMLAGSTKSAVDLKEFKLVPSFLTDDTMLYRKHVEALYNEELLAMRAAYDSDAYGFEALSVPGTLQDPLLRLWNDFLDENPPMETAWGLGYLRAPVSRTQPLMLRRFKHRMMTAYADDIRRLNQALGTEFVNWHAFLVMPYYPLPRRNVRAGTPFEQALQTFSNQQPEVFRTFFSIEGYYRNAFLKPQYTDDIARYNRLHGTAYSTYSEIKLSTHMPDNAPPEEKADWERFVRLSLNMTWIRIDRDAAPHYRSYLEARYGDIQTLNEKYGTAYGSFETVPLINDLLPAGLPSTDWAAFIAGWEDPDTGRLHQPPATSLSIDGIDYRFRNYLKERFKTPEALSSFIGYAVKSFAELSPPLQLADYQKFVFSKAQLRREFILRNYATVLDYMLLHGRGVFNTFVYCTLAVVAALLVNPLAAYAMSRYRLPKTYTLLLFMLLTMAFPPMVTQIPVFLMLRDLNMLNTFAALILPGLAHGYSIFLLKGFFDSLPRELYESAEIDGAGEWRMFWQITMALSKPILAVIALQAFNIAYANFMFALLICQDQQMWTLMVWLYQLQSQSGQGVIYSSLLIAAIPTFIIFIFCQKIIMRGIVVPVEK